MHFTLHFTMLLVLRKWKNFISQLFPEKVISYLFTSFHIFSHAPTIEQHLGARVRHSVGRASHGRGGAGWTVIIDSTRSNRARSRRSIVPSVGLAIRNDHRREYAIHVGWARAC